MVITSAVTLVAFGAVLMWAAWLRAGRPGATERRDDAASYTGSGGGSPRPLCRCIDCYGDEPVHDPWCTYMQEEFGNG